MKYLATIAKAVTAVIAVVLAAALGGQIDLAPWAIAALQAVAAGLAVWAVPNRPQV